MSWSRAPLRKTELDVEPATIDDLADLRSQLLELGFTRAQVAGCIDFVIAASNGERINRASAGRYRKMLAAVENEPPPGRGRRDGGEGNVYALVGPPAAAIATASILPFSPPVAVATGLILLALHKLQCGDPACSVCSQAGERPADAQVVSIDARRGAPPMRISERAA